MTGDEAALAVADTLQSLGIAYMLVGSFSTNVYGVPRATEDADFVVQLESSSIADVADHLGPSFRLDPQMSFETVTMTRRHILHLVGQVFKIEIFYLSDDPHDQERFRRRQRKEVCGRQIYFPTPEDVIVTKLRWASRSRRGKDWDDAHDVIAVQGDKIDWDYVYSWCDRHGTRALLDEIRQSIPPI